MCGDCLLHSPLCGCSTRNTDRNTHAAQRLNGTARRHHGVHGTVQSRHSRPLTRTREASRAISYHPSSALSSFLYQLLVFPKQNPVFSPIHHTAIAHLSATPPQQFCNTSATINTPKRHHTSPPYHPIHRSALAWTADPSTDPVFGSTKNPEFTRREKTPLSKAFQAEKKAAGLRVGSGLRMCAYA